MKRVDSDALEVITKALGITGRGAPVTEFLDGQLEQTLDVTPLVRRGRSNALTSGIFSAVLRNVHAAADSQSSDIFPYEPGTAAVPPFPTSVPSQFDIWLISAALRRISGSGTVEGMLSLQFSAHFQAFGRDQADAAVVVNPQQPLVFWDTLVTEFITVGIHAGIGGVWKRLGLRLPRGPATLLTFASTASAIATYDCQMVLGLFPIGLGQDVVD